MFEEELDENTWFDSLPSEDQYNLENETEENTDSWWDSLGADPASVQTRGYLDTVQDPMSLIPTDVPEKQMFFEEPAPPKPVREERTWNMEGSLPSMTLPMGLNTKHVERAIGGLWNAPRETLETAVALRDTLSGAETLEGLEEVLDVVWPRYKAGSDAQGMIGDIIQEGAGFAAPAGGAMKIGQKVFNQIKSKLVRNTVKAGSVELAGVAGMDKDSEAMILDVFGTDGEGNYSEERAVQKINLALEGLALAKGIELTGKSATVIGRLAKDYLIDPLTTIGSKDKMEETVVRDALDSFINHEPGETLLDRAKKYTEIIDAIERGKVPEVKSGIEGVSDPKLHRDTMKALEEGTDDSKMTARARAFRSGVEGKGSPDLEEAISRSSREGDRYLTEGEQAFGGSKSRAETRSSVQDSISNDTDEYFRDVDRANKKVLESEEGIRSLIKDDPELGKIVTELGDRLDIRLGSRVRDKATDIVETLQRASELMTAEKNRLYNRIPETAIVNREDYLNAIGDVDDLLSDSFRKKLGEAGTSFKKLHNLMVSNDFNKMISAAKNNKMFDDVARLREFKQRVTDDQLDYLILKGDNTTAPIVREAREYFMKEYAPYWRNNPTLQDIQTYSRELREPEVIVRSREKLLRTLSDTNKAEYTQGISDALGTDEGGRNAGLLLDYAMGDVALDAQRMINASKDGSLSPDQIVSLSKKLEEYVPIFEKHEGQVTRINNFLNKLKDKSWSTEQLKVDLKNLEETAKKAEKSLQQKVPSFYKKDLLDQKGTPRTDDSEIFKSVFKNPEELDEVLKRNKNPEGLKSAYFNELSDSLFSTDPKKQGLAGEKGLKPLDSKTRDALFEAGDKVFKDTPEVMSAVRAVFREVQNSRAGAVRKSSVFDSSEVRKGAGQGADFIITLIWGPLSRAGARIRSATGRTLAALDDQKQIKTILENITSNPEEFSRIAKRITEKDIKNNRIPDEIASDLYRMVVTPTVYADGDEEIKMSEEEFLNSLNDLESQTDRALK